MNPEERLANLESTVSFQDRTIEDLNQVIGSLQDRVSRLEAELQRVVERLSAAPLVRDAEHEEPPPHY